MGIKDNLIEFTQEDIDNKELIIKMLTYEDKLFLSDNGQNFLKDYGSKTNSLGGSKSIQRYVLNSFGFSSTNEDLKIYRTIFHNYYNSPTDYDKDILKSVYYMRENRCLYYTTKPLEQGQIIPNTNIYDLNGKDIFNLHELIKSKNYEKTFVAVFSLS